jgi:hypothetical protein
MIIRTKPVIPLPARIAFGGDRSKISNEIYTGKAVTLESLNKPALGLMKANKTTNFELRMSDSCADVARRHNGFYFVRMEGSGNGVVNNTVY